MYGGLEGAVDAKAIPLAGLDGTGGERRNKWLDLLTSDGVSPRSGGVRRIAYALAYHANNKTFILWPGITLLADRQAMGENTVRHAFRWLVENGWLIVIDKGGGRGHPKKYVLSIPPWALEE